MTISVGYTEVTCNVCGKTLKTEGEFNGQIHTKENPYNDWVHTIDLPMSGYPSFLDMTSVSFEVCDACLESWMECFVIQPIRVEEWGVWDD